MRIYDGPLLACALSFGCSSDEKLSVHNSLPEAAIISHSTGDTVVEGTTVMLVGAASDTNDVISSLVAAWYVDGVSLCEGAAPDVDGTTSCELTVAAGEDTEVRLEVRDPDGASGVDTISLVIAATGAPVVDLVTPEDGGVFIVGDGVAFEATVSDGEDEPAALTVWFESSLDGRIDSPTGVSSEGRMGGVLELSLGSHDLALWAEDTDGKTNFDRVSIRVDAVPDHPPTAEILSPDEADDGLLYTGELVALTGVGLDDEDEESALIAQWDSSIDGVLDVDTTVDSAGNIESHAVFSEGTHVLTLTITDTAGQTGTDAVSIIVGAENQQPDCAITAPEDGVVISGGETVSFVATASDPDVPSDWLTARFSSDKDGDLVTTTPTTGGDLSFVTDALSVDAHTITLTVQDELGLSCTDAITLVVSTPPTLTVLSPAADAAVNSGVPISFEATVDDGEDAAVDLVVTWGSDIDGILLEGPPDAGGSSAFVSDVLSAGAHTLTISVVDTSGMYATAVQSLVVNSVPTAPVVSIVPEAPQTDDAILAIMVTPSTDDEGDAVAYSYAWARDGLDMGISSASVTASATAKGQVWTVSVAGSDGMSTGPTGAASVEILNTVPTVAAATVSPTEPAAHDILVCTAGATEDADGDDVSLGYAWTVNGTVTTETTSSYTSALGVGDTISCTVTPSDDEADGTPVVSDPVEIANTAPSIATVTVGPDPAFVTDTLSCSYTGFEDVDGDADVSTINWTIDGMLVGTGDTLATGFSRGDGVVCTVTPGDGITTGDPVSATVTVSNTAPSIASVAISPEDPQSGDTLTCSYTDFTDADGDADASTISWTINGSPAGTGTTLSGGFVGGDELACTVTPDDGTDAGTPSSAGVVVGNTAPSIASVSISPESPRVGDTLSCSYTGFADADDDSDVSTYAWTVNGGAAGTGPTLASGFSGGDAVVCTVTPHDGEDPGGLVAATVTIINSAPSIESVSISPAEAYAGDPLTCLYTGFSDPDGDFDSSTLEWRVNGVLVSTGPFLGFIVVRGDEVVCTVTPSDAMMTGEPVSAGMLIENTAPEVTLVTVTADGPIKVGVTLGCDATVVDADGETPLLSHAWTVAGAGISTDASVTITAVMASPTDAITCTVTAMDASGGTATGSDAVELLNSIPTATDVSVSPDPAYTGDILSCSYTFEDADGDGDETFFQWTVGSTTMAEAGSTLSGGFSGGDSVRCKACPNDGRETGPCGSYAFVVANTAPIVTLVTLSPSVVRTNDTLAATVTSSDADGDVVEVGYAWFVNGELLASGGADLDGGVAFDRGDEVYVVVTPTDGAASGEPVSSETIVVGNSGPSAPVVAVDLIEVRELEQSLSFDGLNDFVRVGTHGLPSGGAPRTIAAWFKSSCSGGTGNIFAYGRGTATDVGRRFSLVANHSGCSLHFVGQGMDHFHDTPYTPGVWQHAVITYDGTLKIYVQGALVGTATEGLSTAAGTDFNIGRNTTDRADEYFQGSVAQVTAWTRALSAEEVAAAFVGADVSGGLVANWQIEEGGGVFTTDDVNGWDGVLEEGPVWTLDAPADGAAALICSIDTPSTDPDGDAVSYTYEWDVDGAPFALAETTVSEGDTIPSGSLGSDEGWTCAVTPSDGLDEGTAGEASIYLAGESTYLAAHGGNMIMIDAQTFEMGCTAEMSSCGADEYPAHTVTLTNAFYMAEMEVTQDQYWAMRGLDPSYFSSCGGNCPVDNVSAHRAAAFANAVSDVEGLERCYECDFSTCTVLIEPYACRGYRLPTEAEWEAAARCGEPTLYAGSAVVDDVAWYSGNSGATTHPVGTKAPNACGLYDMSGNVMEWTADSYSSTGYETSASINPWAGTSDQSVCRGGWARDGTAYVRVTERTMNWTGGAAMFTGFRIARSAGL